MQTSKSHLQKLFLEKYLDIALMTILNVHAWIEYPHLNFWGTPWNAVNSIWNLIWIVMITIYPVYVYIVIRMNKDKLASDKNMQRLGIFYEE